MDYFLFSAKRGYCDYSATAMAVMLRSVGVAARYASGFSTGTFDEGRFAWVVREGNAHAWTEVYFPGYGWIEFEPTPTQRVFGRDAGRPEFSRPIPTPQLPEPKGKAAPLWLWAGGLALLLLFVIVWPPRWFRRRPRSPREVVWRVYERLLRRARWLGLVPQGGQTPWEYLATVAAEVERRAPLSEGAAGDIELIADSYQRARYGNAPITEQEGYGVEGTWRRLRTKLLRLVFVRRSD